MKVILLDDERLALEYLENQLLKTPDITIIGKYRDPMTAKYKILGDEVDVVFLDVSLPAVNGVELAEQLLERKPNLKIVFVTAYDEYAVKAFELNALDYVIKPISSERLTKTLQRMLGDRVSMDQTCLIDEPIHLTVLQQLLIESSKNQLTTIYWRTTKAHELFLYLLQHRGQWVRKSVLIELLWPEYESDKVYAQLYTTVYHVRKTLEPFGDRFQIKNTNDGYILSIHNVVLDVEEWESKLNLAPPINSESINYYKATMKLYTGDYLQKHDFWWAESERHRLKMLWLRTSLQMAEWYCNSNHLEEAIELYLEICDRHPQAEEAYFALMKIYAAQGNHLSVNRQYRLLDTVLQEELNELPSPYITEWYKKWKKDTV